jgi:hypothetical protein
MVRRFLAGFGISVGQSCGSGVIGEQATIPSGNAHQKQFKAMVKFRHDTQLEDQIANILFQNQRGQGHKAAVIFLILFSCHLGSIILLTVRSIFKALNLRSEGGINMTSMLGKKAVSCV